MISRAKGSDLRRSGDKKSQSVPKAIPAPPPTPPTADGNLSPTSTAKVLRDRNNLKIRSQHLQGLLCDAQKQIAAQSNEIKSLRRVIASSGDQGEADSHDYSQRVFPTPAVSSTAEQREAEYRSTLKRLMATLDAVKQELKLHSSRASQLQNQLERERDARTCFRCKQRLQEVDSNPGDLKGGDGLDRVEPSAESATQTSRTNGLGGAMVNQIPFPEKENFHRGPPENGSDNSSVRLNRFDVQHISSPIKGVRLKHNLRSGLPEELSANGVDERWLDDSLAGPSISVAICHPVTSAKDSNPLWQPVLPDEGSPEKPRPQPPLPSEAQPSHRIPPIIDLPDDDIEQLSAGILTSEVPQTSAPPTDSWKQPPTSDVEAYRDRDELEEELLFVYQELRKAGSVIQRLKTSYSNPSQSSSSHT
ncbi:hypothetical protein DFS34DRAFT_621995 [Phlyctochytrium arcticum]|nr:hypothetical protein DFS34DRAFT_621995 [Phlyctochytrium arcticum]